MPQIGRSPTRRRPAPSQAVVQTIEAGGASLGVPLEKREKKLEKLGYETSAPEAVAQAGSTIPKPKPAPGPWESGKQGKWEAGAAGQWESGAAGPWETGKVGRWKKGASGPWDGWDQSPRTPGEAGKAAPNLVGSGGRIRNFDGSEEDIRGDTAVVDAAGIGGGGGGTGAAVPGLASVVSSLKLRSASFQGESVEEVVGRGAKRTRRTGQRRTQ